jgi:6-hydroxycyclohex-1-ene-1-carbonyl-CoA dehydrogenase
MTEPGAPLKFYRGPLPKPGQGEALIAVDACGLCHTDVSFLYGGVRPRAQLPLTLGHEVIGHVVEAPGGNGLTDRTVIVPAVLPCGDCALCRAGRANICRRQHMPGNDLDGGFASHLVVPARHLVPVPREMEERRELAVVADAVSTANQAVLRSKVGAGELVVVVGAGGVGTFAIQAARVLGARVAAIDISWSRLASVEPWIDLALDASTLSQRDIKDAILVLEKQHGLDGPGRKIIECSGSAEGQSTACSLLTFDGCLVVVGYTRDKIEIRLSDLMAFDARIIGNWGCLPEHFPPLLELIADGRIELEPFVEFHPMSQLNDLLRRQSARRPILLPDF